MTGVPVSALVARIRNGSAPLGSLRISRSWPRWNSAWGCSGESDSTWVHSWAASSIRPAAMACCAVRTKPCVCALSMPPGRLESWRIYLTKPPLLSPSRRHLRQGAPLVRGQSHRLHLDAATGRIRHGANHGAGQRQLLDDGQALQRADARRGAAEGRVQHGEEAGALGIAL